MGHKFAIVECILRWSDVVCRHQKSTESESIRMLAIIIYVWSRCGVARTMEFVVMNN